MSNHISPSTRALLDAAKHDGPSREKRAAMWTGITGGLVTHTPLQIKPQGASASGANTGAGAGAAAKGAFWAGASMKGAFIGALFGSAISIGVATFMLRAKPEPAAPPPPPAQVVVASPQNAAPTTNANPASNAQGASAPVTNIELPATNDPSAQSTENSGGSSIAHADPSSADTSRAASAKSSGHATHASKKEPTTSESPDDMLTRETALVAEAHRELLTGDAAAALKSVRAARSLEARQFEPEEMSLEAKALHALGRDSEAERVEAQLRTMYPGR